MKLNKDLINEHKMFLQNLTTATPQLRKILIDEASKPEINAITEIAEKINHGHIKISPAHFDRLKKHKKIIRKISSRSLPHKAKKVILNQKGGFLPVMIAPILAALGSVAGRLISHYLGLQ